MTKYGLFGPNPHGEVESGFEKGSNLWELKAPIVGVLEKGGQNQSGKSQKGAKMTFLDQNQSKMASGGLKSVSDPFWDQKSIKISSQIESQIENKNTLLLKSTKCHF